MGELQEKMLRRMELKNFSKKTIELYLYHMKKYVRYYGKSPDKLGKEEIEKYLHYLIGQKTSSSAMVQAYSSLKYFYSECLERPWELEKIPRTKTGNRLPVVLSPEEIKNIFHEVELTKYKTVLMLIYSTGMRLSEALHIKIKDIDSQRMEIRVEQGKGKKDRYTLLSKIMLNKLREYYRKYKPIDWLFPGRKNKPMSSSSVQRVFGRAKKKRALEKMQPYTHLGTALRLIY